MKRNSVIRFKFSAAILAAFALAPAHVANASPPPADKPAWRELAGGVEVLLPASGPAEKGADGRMQLRAGDTTLVYSSPRTMSAIEAEDRFARKLAGLRSLFQKRSDPYYGTAEPGPHCDLKLLPAALEARASGQRHHAQSLWAAEDFSYGRCDEKSPPYKSQFVLLYCPASKSYTEIRVFYPAASEWRAELPVRCAARAGKIAP